MNYEDYEGLIADLAHKRSESHQEFEDQMSVGREAFLKAERIYDPSKGAFSTILTWVAGNAMIDAYRKNRKHVGHHSYEVMQEREPYADSIGSMMPVRSYSDPAKIVELSSTMGSLGPNAKEILKVVGASYEEVINASTSFSPRYLRGALTKLLRAKGFSWSAIYKGYDEIKGVVRELV